MQLEKASALEGVRYQGYGARSAGRERVIAKKGKEQVLERIGRVRVCCDVRNGGRGECR